MKMKADPKGSGYPYIHARPLGGGRIIYAVVTKAGCVHMSAAEYAILCEKIRSGDAPEVEAVCESCE